MTKFEYAEMKASVSMARAFVTAAQKRYEAAKAVGASGLVAKMRAAMERREQEYYAMMPVAA